MAPQRHRAWFCSIVFAWFAATLSYPVAVRAVVDQGPAEKLQTLPDFKIELVFKADPKVNGTFISLAKDDKGRLLLGTQRGQPLNRLTIQDGQVVKSEVLKVPVSEIMGMLWVGDSLYVDGADSKHYGLFRLRDPNGTGQFESVEMLREWQGGSGEHGTHGIVPGPDHKLYIVSGNFVGQPKDMEPTSPHKNYADDLVLPRAEDGNGFGAGNKPPGGFITRVDMDGKHPELFAAGERNTYDIAFNADGELFGFDSDMEWDWGTPWYRPIRVFHATSGADQGFREGTGKWPEYYADSLPAVKTIGVGCPTGVVFGTGAKFPAKYQKAFYILDWTYGRLIAVHTTPHGATYDATWENLVAPKGMSEKHAATPNNLTDVVIGDDGALYFTTGGRGTQGYLYRVTYTGSEPTAPANLHDADGADARALRHKLEAFHGHADPNAIEAAWPQLGSEDRFIRYAARIAVESQPLDEWKAKALAEKNPAAALTALLALARHGTHDDQAALIEALGRFSIGSLTPTQQLEKLRVLSVSMSRQGKLPPVQAQKVIAELDPLYPANSFELNHELSAVLLALGAPDAVAKTVKLIGSSPTQEEQLWYVSNLRTIKDGWTPELRRAYFSWWPKNQASSTHPREVTQWFEEAGRGYDNGASYSNFLKNLRRDAMATLSNEDTLALADVLANWPPAQKTLPRPAHPRPLVKEWKMEDLEPSLAEIGKGRNFERGKEMFETSQCLACHRFVSQGGAIGPDLSAVASRFTRRDILESVIAPSKVISEQYIDTVFKLANGEVIVGRLVEDKPEKFVVRPNPLEPEKTVAIKKSDVKLNAVSKISPMPMGLVDGLTKDEIFDMIAYIESAGRKDHPDFAAK